MTELLTCNGGRFRLPEDDAPTAAGYVHASASRDSDRYSDDIDEDVVTVKYQRRLDRPFPRMFEFWVCAVVKGIHELRRNGLAPPNLDDKKLQTLTVIRTDRGSSDGVRIDGDVDRLLVSLYIADHPPEDTAAYTPSGPEIVDHLNRYAYAGTKPLIRALRDRAGGNAATYATLPSLLLEMSQPA